MYFESMRLLRLHRDAVSNTFIKGIDAAFQALGKEQLDAQKSDESDFDSLSLVNQEELEITVAVAGIVSKVTSLHSLEIMFLTKRIDHLITGMDVTERFNPLGPQILIEAFVRALKAVDVNITIRIILLKLFERCVMERLGELYSTANRQLSEAGVLPDLHRVAKPADTRQPTTSAVTPASTPSTEHTGENVLQNGDFDFTQISQLLSASRPGMGGFGGGIAGGFGGGFGGGSGNVAIPTAWISTDQLVGTLDHLQSEYPAYDPDMVAVPQAINLTQALAARANRLGASPNAAIRQGDEDVVTFVDILFDYILNDRNLAIPMKALIVRLQIPIVKLAILDKSFFSRPCHPARRLLNDLSSAGIG